MINSQKELEKAVNEFEELFTCCDIADFPKIIDQCLIFIKYSDYDKLNCKRTLRYKIQCILFLFYSLDALCILFTLCKSNSLQVDYLLDKNLKDCDKDVRMLFFNIISTEIVHFSDSYYTEDFYNAIKVIYKSIGHGILIKRLPKSEIMKHISLILINILGAILYEKKFHHNIDRNRKILEIIFNHFDMFGDNWVLEAVYIYINNIRLPFSLIIL